MLWEYGQAEAKGGNTVSQVPPTRKHEREAAKLPLSPPPPPVQFETEAVLHEPMWMLTLPPPPFDAAPAPVLRLPPFDAAPGSV